MNEPREFEQQPEYVIQRRLRELYVLAHYLRRRQDWLRDAKIWGDGLDIPHDRMRITYEVGHTAFYRLGSDLKEREERRR